jgi:hypothetical protein
LGDPGCGTRRFRLIRDRRRRPRAGRGIRRRAGEKMIMEVWVDLGLVGGDELKMELRYGVGDYVASVFYSLRK